MTPGIRGFTGEENPKENAGSGLFGSSGGR